MKLSQIIAPGFNQALATLNKSQLPVVTSWKLKAIVSIVQTENGKFDKMRMELVDRFAPKNPDGSILKDEKGNYKVGDDQLVDFTKAIQELLDIEVEVPTIKVSALGNDLKLSGAELASLEGLVIE